MISKDLEQKIEDEIENCCINIYNVLQKDGIQLTPKAVLGFSDIFFIKLDRQNVKIIRANDPAEKTSFSGE